MGKAAKGKAAKAEAKPLSKRAQESLKKELVHGERTTRLKVLESLHCAGVLASRVQSRDVAIERVTMSIHGREIMRDATVKINHGRRYGLIGANGSGKTTILAAIASRELPIPDHIDIWHVHQEAEPTEITALQAVVDTAAKEVERLDKLVMELSEQDPEGNMEILEALSEKLDKMDPSSFEAEAGALLHGLGFSEAMMHKMTKDMSGGWRMRVSLAQALFQRPTLLVLDEPTNHLDLGACVWLEEYLAKYPFTIILTSHSEDFMNTVCTEIMQLTQDQRLVYWGGNYEQYVTTRGEQEVNQMKAYEKEQDDIKHLQDFIRSCGTFSNMRRQADSKQKIIDKMVEKGLTEKPLADPKFMFNFPDSEKLAPPVLAFDNMSFAYSGKKADYLYENVDFGIDLDSRVALVGPNGAGKSTLLKLMRGDLDATEGQVKRHNHLRIASYNQHSAEILPLDKTPLEHMQYEYDAKAEERGEQKKSVQEWRACLGKYGVAGDLQMRKMSTFSDGQKARVVFAMMSMQAPHMLLLDEPTNHLDMICIDALAEAINKFTGGVVLVSHDFRLIGKVAKEIWVCDGGVSPWKGDIQSYKTHLSKQMKKSAKERMSVACKGASAGSIKRPETPPTQIPSDEEAASPAVEVHPSAPPAVEESPSTPAVAEEPEEEAPKPTEDEKDGKDEEKAPEPKEKEQSPEPSPVPEPEPVAEAAQEPEKVEEKVPEPKAEKGDKTEKKLPPWMQKRSRAKKAAE